MSQYRGRGTNMAAAFQFVREQMYTVANGDRQAAPDVVIMVSGSMANINQAQTIPQAEAARAAGIHVYGLGEFGRYQKYNNLVLRFSFMRWENFVKSF